MVCIYLYIYIYIHSTCCTKIRMLQHMLSGIHLILRSEVLMFTWSFGPRARGRDHDRHTQRLAQTAYQDGLVELILTQRTY